LVRRELGRDPYEHVKQESNKQAQVLYTTLQSLVSSSPDPLSTAIRVAIAGNIMDYGPADTFDFERTVQECLTRDMALDGTTALKSALSGASSLLYLVDNAGEIVCDKLLIETLLSSYPLNRIVVGVKGGPILNDATHEDAAEVGINELPMTRLVSISNGEPDTGFHRESPEFRAYMDSFDVIIAKGQGNYEVLSGYSDIFFLLKAKCSLLAAHAGVPIGSLICSTSAASGD
jgi:uncharacterized protein with ATP-grasp and redox domains